MAAQNLHLIVPVHSRMASVIGVSLVIDTLLCVLQNEADEDDETEEETYVPSDDVSDDEESSEEDSEESNWEDEDGSGAVVFYGHLFFHRFVCFCWSMSFIWLPSSDVASGFSCRVELTAACLQMLVVFPSELTAACL